MIQGSESELSSTEQKPSRRKRNQAYQKEASAANQLLIEGRFEEAFQLVQRMVKQFPKQPENYKKLSLMFEQRGNTQKAAIYFEQYASLARPPDPCKWKRAALLYRSCDRFRRQSYCNSRALKFSPTDIELLQQQAETYLRMNRTRKAVRVYKRALALKSPCHKEISVKCCRLLYGLKEYEQSIRILEGLEPDENVAHMIAECLLKLERHQQCLDLLQPFRLSEYAELLCKRLVAMAALDRPIPNEDLQTLLQRFQVESWTHFSQLEQALTKHCYSRERYQVLSTMVQSEGPEQELQGKYLELAGVIESLFGKQQALLCLNDGAGRLPNSTKIKSQALLLLSEDKAASNKVSKNQKRFQEQQEERIYLSDADEGEQIVKEPKKWGKSRSAAPLTDPSRVKRLLVSRPDSAKELYQSAMELAKQQWGKGHHIEQVIDCLEYWAKEMQEQGHRRKLVNVCLAAVKNKKYRRCSQFRQKMSELGLVAALEQSDLRKALSLAKPLLYSRPSDQTLIRLVAFLLSKTSLEPHRTFLTKLLLKCPVHHPLIKLAVLQYLQSGYFELAVRYLEKLKSDNKISSLLLASCYAQLVSSRNHLYKCHLATKALEHLQEYLRTGPVTPQQEYNSARLLAQLGMGPQSLQLFERLGQSKSREGALARYNLMCMHKHLGNSSLCEQLSRETDWSLLFQREI